MSDWQAVCAILRTEAPEQATRIEARLIAELPGLRLTIPSRISVTRAEAHKLVRETGGDVDKAAKQAGLSRSTMYRRLRAPSRQEQGRLVR